MLFVADFEAKTGLDQVARSQSVGSNVEAVASAVRGLDEVSVVHVFVDSGLDVALAHSGDVRADRLQVGLRKEEALRNGGI